MSKRYPRPKWAAGIKKWDVMLHQHVRGCCCCWLCCRVNAREDTGLEPLRAKNGFCKCCHAALSLGTSNVDDVEAVKVTLLWFTTPRAEEHFDSMGTEG